MVVHLYNLSTWETETGGQPGPYSETLTLNVVYLYNELLLFSLEKEENPATCYMNLEDTVK
jgi:uncharacterized protein YwgA